MRARLETRASTTRAARGEEIPGGHKHRGDHRADHEAVEAEDREAAERGDEHDVVGNLRVLADEDRARWNQRSVTSADLAREYGFTDIDGRQPDGWA